VNRITAFLPEAHAGNSTVNQAQREDWPDIAKGMGITLVVYGHVARGLFNAGIPLDPVWHQRIDGFIYAFHMPLFFWVSGYLYFFSIQKKGTLAVLQDKLRNVAYLYVLWSLVHGLIEVAMSHYTNGHLALRDVLALWQPRAHFWFLYVLFLVFAIATGVYRFRNRWATLGVLLVAILWYQNPGVLEMGYPLVLVGPWLVYFAAGVAVAQFKPVVFRQAGWVLPVLLAPLALGSNWPLLWASLGVVSVLSLSRWLDVHGHGPARAALIYLGQLSLPIYLLHILSGSGIRIVLQKFVGLQNVGVHLIAGMALALLVPILVHQLSVRYHWRFLWAWPVARHG